MKPAHMSPKPSRTEKPFDLEELNDCWRQRSGWKKRHDKKTRKRNR